MQDYRKERKKRELDIRLATQATDKRMGFRCTLIEKGHGRRGEREPDPLANKREEGCRIYRKSVEGGKKSSYNLVVLDIGSGTGSGNRKGTRRTGESCGGRRCAIAIDSPLNLREERS